jgi:hypothetical protein
MLGGKNGPLRFDLENWRELKREKFQIICTHIGVIFHSGN